MARKISDSKLIAQYISAYKAYIKASEHARKTAFYTRPEELAAIEASRVAQQAEQDLYHVIIERNLSSTVNEMLSA